MSGRFKTSFSFYDKIHAVLTRLWQAIRPAVLWSYRRGSWQYDLIVVGILAFIFIGPRFIDFGDQPRPQAVQQIKSLSDDDQGTLLFWVDPSVIDEIPPEQVHAKLGALLQQKTGKTLQVIDTKPTPDEGEVRAYLVYARP